MTDPNISTPEDIADITERHAKGYLSSSDEAYDRSPICRWCGYAWPCDVAVLLAAYATAEDRRPHSRACSVHRHDHGPFCHRNCPTCHGSTERVN